DKFDHQQCELDGRGRDQRNRSDVSVHGLSVSSVAEKSPLLSRNARNGAPGRQSTDRGSFNQASTKSDSAIARNEIGTAKKYRRETAVIAANQMVLISATRFSSAARSRERARSKAPTQSIASMNEMLKPRRKLSMLRIEPITLNL